MKKLMILISSLVFAGMGMTACSKDSSPKNARIRDRSQKITPTDMAARNGGGTGQEADPVELVEPDAEKTVLTLSKVIMENTELELVPRETSLVMSVQNEPIEKLRSQLDLNLKLDDEAHITTVTPPEYEILKEFVTMKRIEEIAKQSEIQSTEITVLGLGSAKKTIDEKVESTYFLIVGVPGLNDIRTLIHEEYVKNGGKADAWNPDRFHPHITIGYTLRDLHETDGIIKDLENSLDENFEIELTEK